MTAGAAALAALRFNYAESADDVWRHSDHHVDGLHGPSAGIVLTGLAEAAEGRDTSPIGVVVQGQRGTGKTHLLGWVREQAQRRGGYFVLVGLLDAKGFWESTVVSVLDSLSRDAAEGQSQLGLFLTRLASAADLSRMERRAVSGRKAITREVLDRFVTALRRLDRQVGSQAQDTARALVLYASDDLALQDIGEAFLSSAPEGEPGERARWGIRQVDRTPQEIVRDVSRLLALTGPAIVAVDQIDALVAQSPVATDPLAREPGESAMIERIAGGLMDLREVTRRTLTVVTCLPATWTLIEKVAVDTVRDRFRQAVQLKTLPDAQTAARLVARRFEVQYAAAGFEPPYPTWPVRPEAFEQAPGFTPRQLLITIDDHVRGCVQDGQVRELTRLTGSGTGTPRQSPAPDAGLLAAIDARFARLRDAAEPPELDAATEDVIVPALLAAGLTAWVGERGEAGKAFSVDPPPSAKPPLHARLRHTLDEETEDEAHWAFRAVSAAHGNAALNRVRKASVAAGLDPRVPKRRLFLLRNAPWSPGVRTKEAIAAFEHAGGRTLPVTPADLKVLAALKALLAENPPGLASWLTARRPTSAIPFLTQALTGPWTVPPGPPKSGASTSGVEPSGPGGGTPEAPAPAASGAPAPGAAAATTAAPGAVAPATAASGSGGGAVRVPGSGGATPQTAAPAAGGATPRTAAPSPVVSGVSVSGDFDGGEYVDVGVRVGLEGLRKHVAIFAGTGSGKTVLIRRLVEECALRGVSAIVLDPNNDLARLGDRWPERPEGWAEGDERKAEAYLAGTDVVVWTPRRAAGRPLSFQPLPDLAGVAADPDEFGEAVEAAMAAVAPRLKLTAQTVKAQRGQAVLRKALEWYGRRGGTTLRGLAGMLAALPEGVSELADAERIAADLAQSLRAAMDNDPLFGGEGTPVDPGLLLTPPPGRRARVSVVSLAGLPGDEQRQSFVSQLQLALFAWVKKNPAGDRPLGGLFVMDEAQTFAPAAGGVTACLRSTLALASQARKYGLGLVFATQAPKGLHNQIPGNAATQFFGLLNAPIQIGAAREMARAKGGDVPDVSRLRSGEFYVALEGRGPVRTRVPMCLSHHPRAPLTTEEVIARAARPSPPVRTSRPAQSSC